MDTLIGTQGGMRELERQVLLQVMDRKWREHLYEMDYLKEGIGLRAMAQRDPLIEYQREGFDMFSAMLEGIKEETVGHLFNVQVQVAEPAAPEPQPADRVAQAQAALSAMAAQQQPAQQPAPVRNAASAQRQTSVPADATTPIGHVPAAAQANGSPADGADDDTPTSVLPAAFRGQAPQNLQYSGPDEDGGESVRRGENGGGNGGRPQTGAPRRAGGQGGTTNRADRRRQERAARKQNG
jgi:preprotein translocase subunit SecA